MFSQKAERRTQSLTKEAFSSLSELSKDLSKDAEQALSKLDSKLDELKRDKDQAGDELADDQVALAVAAAMKSRQNTNRSQADPTPAVKKQPGKEEKDKDKNKGGGFGGFKRFFSSKNKAETVSSSATPAAPESTMAPKKPFALPSSLSLGLKNLESAVSSGLEETRSGLNNLIQEVGQSSADPAPRARQGLKLGDTVDLQELLLYARTLSIFPVHLVVPQDQSNDPSKPKAQAYPRVLAVGDGFLSVLDNLEMENSEPSPLQGNKGELVFFALRKIKSGRLVSRYRLSSLAKVKQHKNQHLFTFFWLKASPAPVTVSAVAQVAEDEKQAEDEVKTKTDTETATAPEAGDKSIENKEQVNVSAPAPNYRKQTLAVEHPLLFAESIKKHRKIARAALQARDLERQQQAAAM